MKAWRSAAARRIKELTRTNSVDAAAIEIARRLTDGQQPPPTDLEKIFPRVDIQSCYPDPNLMIAGELRKADEGFEIAYSESESILRRRFTIAHEIAHAVFERTGPRCPRRGRELEKLCDMIASQILVPHDVFIAEAGSPINLPEIRRLAKRFETSLTVMAIRCADRFSIMCAQAEHGEITWQAGASKFGLRRPRPMLKRLLSLTGEQINGRELCSIDFNDDSSRAILLEWTRTGNERLLLVLTPWR